MIFTPSRRFRREQTGNPCSLCARLMHHGDIVAVADERTTRFAHGLCVAQLSDEAANQTETTEGDE